MELIDNVSIISLGRSESEADERYLCIFHLKILKNRKHDHNFICTSDVYDRIDRLQKETTKPHDFSFKKTQTTD